MKSRREFTITIENAAEEKSGQIILVKALCKINRDETDAIGELLGVSRVRKANDMLLSVSLCHDLIDAVEIKKEILEIFSQEIEEEPRTISVQTAEGVVNFAV